MPINYHNAFLLTGAGFTKNFGGFLATEMWAQIYNNPKIQGSPYLRALLQDDFDFESIYSKVIEDESVSEDDKERIRIAIKNAYKNLDEAIKGWTFNSTAPYPVCWYTLNRLLGLFHNTPGKQGFWFTLNQDLFMERRNGVVSPGVPPFHGRYGPIESSSLEDSDFVSIPQEETETKVMNGISSHAGLAYIKLHGSYGWKSQSNPSQLVIGKNKVGMIADEALLQVYFQVFQDALLSGEKKLLVIGYGFRDDHINEVIAKAVREAGLRIYVISTSSPEKWKATVTEDSRNGTDIVRGLAGYYPYSLLELFPTDQTVTSHLLNLETALRDS